MRISDWSSDVCSSDLIDRVQRQDDPRVRKEGAVRMEAEFSSPQPAFIRLGRNEVHPFRGPGHGFENIDDFGLALVAELLILEDQDLPIPQEIGRASCRERVCQYV